MKDRNGGEIKAGQECVVHPPKGRLFGVKFKASIHNKNGELWGYGGTWFYINEYMRKRIEITK